MLINRLRQRGFLIGAAGPFGSTLKISSAAVFRHESRGYVHHRLRRRVARDLGGLRGSFESSWMQET